MEIEQISHTPITTYMQVQETSLLFSKTLGMMNATTARTYILTALDIQTLTGSPSHHLGSFWVGPPMENESFRTLS